MMDYHQNENPNNGSKGTLIFIAIVFIIGIVMVMKAPGGLTGSSQKSSKESTTKSSTYNSNTYKYSSGSSSSYRSGNRSSSSYSSSSNKKSYSSGTTKKKASTSQNKKTTNKYYTKQKSAKQQAYDDFMEDALEGYLTCVESDDEYWDAVENFGEDWLTKDEKNELDRLMKSYSD